MVNSGAPVIESLASQSSFYKSYSGRITGIGGIWLSSATNPLTAQATTPKSSTANQLEYPLPTTKRSANFRKLPSSRRYQKTHREYAHPADENESRSHAMVG